MSERMVGSMLSPVLGTGGQFTWRKGQAGGPYKKLKVGRTRTQSSDSGCELSLECSESLLSSELFLDEVVTAWVGRVEGVLRQEEERAREVTMWAREALRQSANMTDQEEEKEKRRAILQGWQGQIEGVLQFTSDLIDCVNTDTKEMIQEELTNMDFSGHDTSSTIEEEFEEYDDDGLLEEEIIQMFSKNKGKDIQQLDVKERLSSKKLLKEFMTMYKKNRRKMKMKKSKKANKEVQTAYAKMKRQDVFNKRRHSSSESNKGSSVEVLVESGRTNDQNYRTKMFESVIAAEEFFSDWNWNFKEFDDMEQIFADWRWNIEEPLDLKVNFYDDHGTPDNWNNFNFWKPAENQEIDSGCLADVDDTDSWENCLFWENTFVNETIIRDLQDDNHYENNFIDTHNFWDESAVNQNIISSLIDQEECVKKEHKDIVLLWDDDKIIFSLLDDDDMEDKTPPIQFFSTYEWDDVDILNSLLEENKKEEKEEEKNEWDNWGFWDAFGTAEEILEASEEILKPKNVNKEIQRELYIQVDQREDLDDIFSEEVSKILEDEARDKLRHVMKKRKVFRKKKEDIKGMSSPLGLGHKRPGTPTILTVTVGKEKQRAQRGERGNPEVKNRKQKVCQQTYAVRRRRKLESKMRAKQPRGAN